MANTLNKNAEDSEGIRDGMDASLIKVDEKKKTVSFAGANNPIYIIRDGELTEFKGDKMHIGRIEKIDLHYKQQEIPYKEGDCLYLFSDGFPDQFGGPKGKKYMYKQFKKKLIEISDLEMTVQYNILQKELKNWIDQQAQNGIEQIDDILVIGIRL